MKHIKIPGATLVIALLISCTSDNAPAPISVESHTLLELENYSATAPSSTLEWLPVSLEEQGAAVSLVARQDVPTSELARPTLTYAIDFPDSGDFALSVRARRDSRFASAQPVNLIFGADTGDLAWSISGVDDQWLWYHTDDAGQQIIAPVATPGGYQLQIVSQAEGLLLDQLEFRKIVDEQNRAGRADEPITDNVAPDVDNPPQADDQAPANAAPTASINADTTVATGIALGLSVTVVDDEKPHGALYYYWTKIDGPGTVGFSSKQTAVSSATFDQPGDYTVQVTVSDGELFTNALHRIAVTDPMTAENPLTSDPANDNVFNDPASLSWHTLTTSHPVTARHETGGVVVNGKLYVIGGRGERPVEVYDPVNNTWQHISNAPLEMHHFQPVAIGHKIYIAGAFTCCYPREDIIEHVYIFDTISHQWDRGPKLPANRQRGSAGAVAHNGKIYIIGGNTQGHSGGAVNWLDEFDPATGKWTVLSNAPDARDHVTVAVVNAKLVVAGGRQTNTPVPFANTVARTNVYDFQSGRWSSAADIPTERAGTMAVALGDDIIIIGGESATSAGAHRQVEAFNVTTGQWRALDDLRTARHGGAAGVLNGQIHVAAGNTTRGGGRETSSHEILR